MSSCFLESNISHHRTQTPEVMCKSTTCSPFPDFLFEVAVYQELEKVCTTTNIIMVYRVSILQNFQIMHPYFLPTSYETQKKCFPCCNNEKCISTLAKIKLPSLFFFLIIFSITVLLTSS